MQGGKGTIRITIEPMGKPRLSRADTWKQRAVVQRWYAYKDQLRLKLGRFTLPEQLRADFYLPMPASWSKKRQLAMAGQPHQGKPDIDNLAKGLMDALSRDDAHVWDLHARKFWGWAGTIVIYAGS